MAFQVIVKGDTRDVERMLKRVNRKAIPRATSRAINETARKIRSDGTKRVAQGLRLPMKFVRKRFTVGGEVKGDRVRLKSANQRNWEATLDVYLRGLPVFQVAGAQTKSGVNAKGGRHYKSAFKRVGKVFKRRTKKRKPLMMPKIGLRKILLDVFEKMVRRDAKREYTKRFNRLARYEIERAGG